jgi:Ala-tRNA(Pro) deacylase
MDKIDQVLEYLCKLGIKYDIYRHPPLPTIEVALQYWKDIPGTHCKNLFFRNHKGDQHYLVIFECHHNMDIHDLEKRLKQGKLSFASPERMERHLGLTPGSVSPFGLINDTNHHVKLFIDSKLLKADLISFHPNINTASVVITRADFEEFLKSCSNEYTYMDLY